MRGAHSTPLRAIGGSSLDSMTETWLITGAGRGMCVEFAAALAAVEPGFFRTELLRPEATAFGELSIHDYDEARPQSNAFWASMNGTQAGDPAKLARALVELADSDEPPLRWVAGEDVVAGVEHKARLLLAQVAAHRELSSSLAHDDAKAVA